MSRLTSSEKGERSRKQLRTTQLKISSLNPPLPAGIQWYPAGIERIQPDMFNRVRVGLLNATSLHKHMESFQQFLTTARPFYDIFGVAESRFSPEVDDKCIWITDYYVTRLDRNTRGECVALYVNNMYKATLLCSSPMNQAKRKPLIPEYIMCSMNAAHGYLPSIFVALFYNPLGNNFPSQHNIIDADIKFLSSEPPVLNEFKYRDFK